MPDTIITGQRAGESEADRAYHEGIAEIDAEHRANAEGASWFDEFTNLEEAIRHVRSVAKILMEFGASDTLNQSDPLIMAYLGEQLLDHSEDAQDAFRKLHSLRYLDKTRAL